MTRHPVISFICARWLQRSTVTALNLARIAVARVVAMTGDSPSPIAMRANLTPHVVAESETLIQLYLSTVQLLVSPVGRKLQKREWGSGYPIKEACHGVQYVGAHNLAQQIQTDLFSRIAVSSLFSCRNGRLRTSSLEMTSPPIHRLRIQCRFVSSRRTGLGFQLC